MLCIIGSSNALQRTIRSHYPNTGDRRISTVLNSCIYPLVSTDSDISPIIDILWARCDKSDDVSTSNHFVPLFTVPGYDYTTQTQQKRTKQLHISNKFKNCLGASNISTKRETSINFNMETKRIRHWFPKLNQNDRHHLPNMKVQISVYDDISSTNTTIIEPLTCARKGLVTVSKLIDRQTDLNIVITEGEIPGDIKD